MVAWALCPQKRETRKRLEKVGTTASIEKKRKKSEKKGENRATDVGHFKTDC